VTFSLGKYKDMNFINFITKMRTLTERKIPTIALKQPNDIFVYFKQIKERRFFFFFFFLGVGEQLYLTVI
jgi:hypothetical protein